LPRGAFAQDSVAESRDMRLVGYSDLQGRTACQPTIVHQGGRWIAYVGHHGDQKPNPLTGALAQRHLDRRRHGSRPAAVPRAHPR
jgi:hypothetical protein